MPSIITIVQSKQQVLWKPTLDLLQPIYGFKVNQNTLK
jgi:hypothetical protein